MVARHAVGTHRPELTVEAGPELLQAHAPTLTRGGRSRRAGPRLAHDSRHGFGALDVVLQIAVALALLVSIVLLIRNYRGR